MGTMDFYNSYKSKTTINGTVNTIKDKNTSVFLNHITYGFYDSPSYYQVTKTINGVLSSTLYDTWIMDTDSYKEPTSKKKIIMKPGQDLNRGDIINWNNQQWLVTNMDMQVFPYDEGVLEYCNSFVKCILPSGKLVQTPCVIVDQSKRNLSLEKDGTLMESQKMLFLVTVQNNSDTNSIPVSYRFLFGKMAYRVNDINDIALNGIITFLVTANQNRATDNFITGLADNSIVATPTVSGVLILQGSSTIILNAFQSYKVIYDNGTLATGTFVFTVDKPSNVALTVIDGLNCSLKGNISSQIKLTATSGATILTKIISIANFF